MNAHRWTRLHITWKYCSFYTEWFIAQETKGEGLNSPSKLPTLLNWAFSVLIILDNACFIIDLNLIITMKSY